MTVVPLSIQRWYRKHPEFLIRLHEFSNTPQTERAVLAGGGRIGIGPAPVTWSGPVRSLGWDELVAVLPMDEPGEPFEPIRLESLADRGWVLYERTHGLRSMTDAACSSAGFIPRAVAETGQIETAARLAAAGLGPSLVPRHTVPKELSASVRVLEPAIMWEVAAYSRSSWPRYVDAYLEMFKDTALDRDPPERIQRISPAEFPPVESA
jgi:DNA-binding transcriptional LysR family regulator